MEQSSFEVDLRPAKVKDFSEATAREEKQPNGIRNLPRIDLPLVFRLGKMPRLEALNLDSPGQAVGLSLPQNLA